jgi:threonine/homoserine/homoserine lactone efflux protein
LRARKDGVDAAPAARGPGGQEFLAAIGLTLTNPPTILTFAALLTALAPPEGLGMPAALATVAGVFTGSLLWWVLVVALVMGLRHALGTGLRLWIDRVSGVALLGLGLVALWRGGMGLLA